MVKLYYIVSLHQTTTVVFISFTFLSCIISFLYIKPQLVIVMLPLTIVVLYRFSTSNHNSMVLFVILILLYYIVSLHQTTTDNQFIPRWESCIISFLYIKPQLVPNTPQCLPVVLYRFSTSNHNSRPYPVFDNLLYYIVSLHQTTTAVPPLVIFSRCIISFLYIKPQPHVRQRGVHQGCIISFLYIKPQP